MNKRKKKIRVPLAGILAIPAILWMWHVTITFGYLALQQSISGIEDFRHLLDCDTPIWQCFLVILWGWIIGFFAMAIFDQSFPD